MSRGLAQFVAGMGAGYLKADRQRIEDERQAKLDKMREDESSMRKTQFDQQNEIYQAGRTERENKTAISNAIAQNNQAGQVEGNVATANYTDASGQAKSAYQPDAATADFALQQQALESGGAMPGTPGNTTSVGTATSVKKPDGGRELFTGMDSAAKAKAYADESQPGSYAGYMNLRKRLMAMPGGEEAADKVLERAKRADKEGVFRAINLAQKGSFAEAREAYNSTGIGRLTDNQDLRFGADGKTVEMFDKDSGKVITPDINQALAVYLNGAEGVIAQSQAANKLKNDMSLEQWKIQNDPSKRYLSVKPGTQVYDTVGENAGKKVIDNSMGYVEDANGNLVRPGKYANTGSSGSDSGSGNGSGGSDGKKSGGKDPLSVVTASVMDAIKESAESKTLSAQQLIGVQAVARELVANAARNKQELDPYVAGKLALTAELKPDSVKPAYNQNSGILEKTISYNGNTFSVGRIDQAAMPEGQLKNVAQAFVSKLPAADKSEYIKAAGGDKATLDKLNADIIASHKSKQWVDAFAASRGRKPTEQDVQDSIARTRAVVGQNIQMVNASGAVEQDKAQRAKESRQKDDTQAKAVIGTREQIMALPPGKAAEIYRQYGNKTDGFQREALQLKMQQDRRQSLSVGGLSQN